MSNIAIASSEYQRREMIAKELEKKKKRFELLDFNYQIKIINSEISTILENFPKSIPSEHSNIEVFPNKVKRIAWLLHTYQHSVGKYQKIVYVFLTEKGELVLEAPIDEIKVKEHEEEDETVTVRKCFFLKLSCVKNSFGELNSGIDYLVDADFFKEVAFALAGLFCSTERFKQKFNIDPYTTFKKYDDNKPSVLNAKEEYAKERNEAYLKVAIKVAVGVLCALVVIFILVKVL